MLFPVKSLLVFIASLALAGIGFAEVKVGEAFPKLASYKLDGVLPPLADRVVLVDFWATWCAPCKSSFPAYTKLQTELAERGFTLVAVSVDTEKVAYDAFLKRFAPGFCAVRDGGQKLVAEVNVPTMPTSYLIDRHGVLRFMHSGYRGEATAQALRIEILRLLEEKP